jgi:hypothetical protein|tara:strand:+ start:445 stop:1200 length:756 start_codon:yes stop_codon:yes gene_type:complete
MWQTNLDPFMTKVCDRLLLLNNTEITLTDRDIESALNLSHNIKLRGDDRTKELRDEHCLQGTAGETGVDRVLGDLGTKVYVEKYNTKEEVEKNYNSTIGDIRLACNSRNLMSVKTKFCNGKNWKRSFDPTMHCYSHKLYNQLKRYGNPADKEYCDYVLFLKIEHTKFHRTYRVSSSILVKSKGFIQFITQYQNMYHIESVKAYQRGKLILFDSQSGINADEYGNYHGTYGTIKRYVNSDNFIDSNFITDAA